MKYKILTERDKEIREIFKKLVHLAYKKSKKFSLAESCIRDRRYKPDTSGIPGELLKELTDEERELLKTFTVEDIPEDIVTSEYYVKGWYDSKEEELKWERDNKICQTCHKEQGIERTNNGLKLGIHCEKCWMDLIIDARKRSW
jgi:hypothetical protein